MNDTITIETILTIFAGIIIGLMYIANRRISLEKYHPATFTLSYSLIGAVFATPLLLYQFKIATTKTIWLLALVSPMLFALANYLGFKAYKTTEASVVGLIGRFSLVIAALGSVVLLKEELNILQQLGLLTILIGSLLIIYEKRRITLNKGIVFAVMMATGFGFVAVLDRVVLEEFSPFTYVFFNNFIIMLILLTVPKPRKEFPRLIKTQKRWALASALFGLVGWTGFLFAIQTGDLSRLYPIWESTALITTVLVGIVWLHEKKKLWQKTAGIVITIVGIVLIS